MDLRVLSLLALSASAIGSGLAGEEVKRSMVRRGCLRTLPIIEGMDLSRHIRSTRIPLNNSIRPWTYLSTRSMSVLAALKIVDSAVVGDEHRAVSKA